MTERIETQIAFSFHSRKKIVSDFDGGRLSTEGGLLPLRQFDQGCGFTRGLTGCLLERRAADQVDHGLSEMLRQRVYQIVAGYEDANDADRLRHDPVLQLVADRKVGEALSSQPTLSRWENRIQSRELLRMGEGMVQQFVRRCRKQVTRRGEILLDVDSTDDPTHGQQAFSFFNGAYDQHMYHPLLVTERHTGYLLLARLRPGTVGSGHGIVPSLLRLVRLLRSAFPKVRIRLRADAGFAIPQLYEFCEYFGIEYAIGFPAHVNLKLRTAKLRERVERRYRRTGESQRRHSSFGHRAHSWKRRRRICVKAEHNAGGPNLRLVVTNLGGRAEDVFTFYNDRGECENRIEELKNGFAGDRLSCHRFKANAFRLLLHACAYNLVTLFRLMLPTELRSLQIEALRLRLFKLAARVRTTARCIRIHFATGWPFQTLFRKVARAAGG